MEFDSDQELWSRSLRGDGDAFAILFDRHERRVYRAVLRIAEDSASAEDLVATVFLELWRRREDVNLVENSLAPWLLVTAANVTRNANRSLRRYRAVLAKLPAPTSTVPLHVNLENREITAALRRLPRRDAEILALVVIDEMPVADAATALGISAQTARARLSRARKRVRVDLLRLPTTAKIEGSAS